MNNQPSSQTATDADFQQTVIEKSKEIPVLVDFWAPWCAPCKTLGPILEKLTAEWGGRFVLVKVNMDENPGLTQGLGIKSIPAVKLIENGQIVDEFLGALPEPDIRKFLEKNLPSDVEQDAIFGMKLWMEGEKFKAMEIFQKTLEKDQKNQVALIGLGNYLVEQGELESAQKIVSKVDDFDLDQQGERAMLVRAVKMLKANVFLLENSNKDNSDGKQRERDDLSILFMEACRKALKESYQEALEDFLSIVKIDRKFREDAGRKGLLAVLDIIPEDSPLVLTYRSQLSALLFR